MKEDDLSPAHLVWLVKSRAANQHAAIELFMLFEKYPSKMKSKELSPVGQELVATCFSLWRAAFLADKTGMRKEVFEGAKTFLGKMLIDNAINYSQDRIAREWTFNYYMNSAMFFLLDLSKRWNKVRSVLFARKKTKRLMKGTTEPQRRWNRHQKAFEAAIKYLAEELESSN